ncbi:MAG: hypothetical protein FWF02_02880 [Micrococcales bacterium]|nr:hypothetical protein [Micrococcales bacterium]MCL2666634.1 hypothetical protein [Micrococcales bacterium]
MFTYTYSTNSPDPRPMSPAGIAWMRLLAASSREDLDRVVAECGHYPGIAEAARFVMEFNADEDMVREAHAHEDAKLDSWIAENLPEGAYPDREAVRELLRSSACIEITVRPAEETPGEPASPQ